MKAIFFACALVIAGCASQPSSTAPPTANAQPQEPVSDSELQKQRLADAMKRGYRLVNTDGQELYCRSDWATGSRIQKTTVCLTAQQLDEIHLRNEQSLEQQNTPINFKKPGF